MTKGGHDLLQKSEYIVQDSLEVCENSVEATFAFARGQPGVCIDGGAGLGAVTNQLAGEANSVICFEPFPGNIPYFKANVDMRNVTLVQGALGSKHQEGSLFVSETVSEKSPQWQGIAGYSSLGKLVSEVRDQSDYRHIRVNVCQLADFIHEPILLLKLDLQGGELPALIGAKEKLELVETAVVEFMLDWPTLDYLIESGFEVYDSGFTGVPKTDIVSVSNLFSSYSIVPLTTGKEAIRGRFRNLPRQRREYAEFLEEIRSEYFQNLWTDLIATRVSERLVRFWEGYE